jgi:hypothetical protein
MNGSNIEFAALRNEGEMRSWLAENGCPDKLAARVIERRTQMPGFKPAQEQPVADSDYRYKVRAGGIL